MTNIVTCRIIYEKEKGKSNSIYSLLDPRSSESQNKT